ncbi:MAG: hypothetical protein ACOYM9_07965 [Bradymonadia bacterium]|jgi:hypothetical protein
MEKRVLRIALLAALLLTVLSVNRLALLEARVARASDTAVIASETLYVPDDRSLRLLFLGYTQAAADVQWLRALEYFGRHFTTDRKYTWLEHFIDQIIRLDPQFRRIYHWAGVNVLYGRRFTNENVERSNRFFERALAAFPEDSEAAFRLGINYYTEMQSSDPDERARYREIGLQYFERAANMPGASPAIRRLVTGTANRLGRTEIAVQSLIDSLAEADDPEQRAAIRARIRSLRGASADALANETEVFENRRRMTFPYVPPALFLHFAGEDSVDESLSHLTRGVVVETTSETLEAP